MAEISRKRVGELIAACENNGVMHSDESAAANIREMRRDYDLAPVSIAWPIVWPRFST